MSDRINQLESKFLDFSKRTRDEHPAKALTPDEREELACLYEAKGHVNGAQALRNYVDEKPQIRKTPPRKKRKM